MKYRPEFPERFGFIEHARAFSQTFFPWYNKEHYHSELGLLTPKDVHYGRTPVLLKPVEKCFWQPTNASGTVQKEIPKPMGVPAEAGSISHHRV